MKMKKEDLKLYIDNMISPYVSSLFPIDTLLNLLDNSDSVIWYDKETDPKPLVIQNMNKDIAIRTDGLSIYHNEDNQLHIFRSTFVLKVNLDFSIDSIYIAQYRFIENPFAIYDKITEEIEYVKSIKEVFDRVSNGT